MSFLRKILIGFIIFTGGSSFAAIGGAGNGGHIDEMQFTTDGYRVYAYLLELQKRGQSHFFAKLDLVKFSNFLKAINIRFVKPVELKELAKLGDRHCLNFPEINLIKCNEEKWRELKVNPDKFVRLQFVFHEISPIVSKNDNYDKGYKVSALLFEEIKKLERVDSPQTPVILYNKYFNRSQLTGFSWDSVQQICQRQKQIHHAQYFFVYCTFLDKRHTQVWARPASEQLDMYLSKDHHYHLQRELPYDVQQTVEKSVYGLRVFGLGNSNNPIMTTVFDSRIDVQPAYGFTTEKLALRRCRLNRAQWNDLDIKFYRAKCGTYYQGNRFYYFIATNNPLIQ